MESFRKFVQGWLGRTFLGLVLLVFVVTMFWDTTPPGAQGELVEVNGQKIFQGELDQAVESIMSRYAGQIDRETLSKLIDRNGVLESLVRQRVLVDAAKDLDLVAHPATIQQSIQAIEGFQDESGKFSEQIFQQVISRNGFANAAAFRQRVADELLSSQLTGGLRDSAFATRGELELLTRIGEQKRDVSWAVLSPAAFVATVNATDAEVKARYEGNPAGYMTEEQFAIEYIEVNLDQYAAAQAPSEADVQAKYEQMVAQAQQSAERRVAQIRIATGGERDEAQAMARADEALAKLAAGETFAKVAAVYSDDAGSRDSGGDLGFVSRGVLEPALDEALFALKAGDVSQPVKATDGVYLVKLLEVRAVAVPPLAQARAGIVASLSRDKAREQYDSVLEELGNLAYESDNLQEPASKLGLQVQSTGLFGRSGGPGIAASQKVLKELLAPHVLEDGQNSGVIAVDESRSVVVRLKEHRKPERRPLEEVAGVVRNEIIREKAAEVAKQKIENVRKAVAAGGSLEAAAAAEGATVQSAAGVQRRDTSVPREVLQAAFRTKKADGAAAVSTTGLAGGSWAAVAVGTVVDGTLLGVPPEQVAALRGELAGEFGRAEFNRFLDEATAEAKVVRLRAEDKKPAGDALN